MPPPVYTHFGLTGDGLTTHFQIQYDPDLTGGKDLANAVLQDCEGDYQVIQNWFNPLRDIVTSQITVNFAAEANSRYDPDFSTGTPVVYLYPGTSPSPSDVRYLLVCQVAEVFTRFQFQTGGWYGGPSAGSQGLAL